MYCPKCNKENPDDARVCRFCNASITDTLDSKQPVTVTISKLASFSLTCALCGLALTLPALIAITSRRVLSPRSEWVVLTFLLSLLILVVSLILGIISIIRIEKSGGKITGRAFAIGAVLLPVFGGLFPVWFIIANQPRSVAYSMVCGSNLSRIGKAMLMYSNDYDNEFPRAGGKNSVWSNHTPNWRADSRFVAYSLNADGTGGRATISSSLYLLVKYEQVEPKRFVCKQDSGTTEFKPARYDVPNKKLIDLWDFGPEPTKHCSYSYHMPYGPYALTSSYLPGMAVAADRNPWQDSPFAKARDFHAFNPDDARNSMKTGNSISHQGDGQNVLFMDAHVGFEKRSFCAVNEDNIYTYWDGPDIRRGAFPVLGSQPTDRLDSMLVNDPAIPR